MKKRKLQWSALLMALLLVLSLTACGSSSSGSSAARDSYASEAAVSSEAAYGYYDADVEEAEYDAASGNSSSGGADASQAQEAASKANVKIIYTANLNVEALNLDVAVDALNKLVNDMGGYIQSSDRGTSGRSRYASYTIRIPSAKYRAFLDAWSDSENCKVTSSHEDTEDVGVRYFDLETHLTTLRNKMNRLQALLEQATEMEAIIQLESAISDTEYQIEMYTSDLNRYDSLINYSTVNLSISEVIQLVEEEEISFGQRLGQNLRWGAKHFVEGLEEFAIWVAYNLIGIIIFVVLLVLFLRWLRRRRQERRENPRPGFPGKGRKNRFTPPAITPAAPEPKEAPESPAEEQKN